MPRRRFDPERDEPTGTRATAVHELQAFARDQRIWALRVEGRTLRQIADTMSMEPTDVKRRLQALAEAQRSELAEESADALMIELARLEAQTRAVWPRITEAIMLDPGTGAPVLDSKGQPRRHTFDPRAHTIALQVHAARARLYGWDRVKVEISGPGGGSIKLENGLRTDRLTPEELAALEYLHKKAAGLDDVIDVTPEPVDAPALGAGTDER